MFPSHDHTGMIRESSEKIRNKYAKDYPNLNPLFTFAVPGFNMRSTELNAVVGLSQLPRLDAVIEKRCNNLKVWLENLDSEYFFTNFIEQGNSNFSLPLILKSPNEKTFQKICKKINELSIEYRKGTAGGGSQANQPYLKNYNYKISGDLTNVNHIHNFLKCFFVRAL